MAVTPFDPTFGLIWGPNEFLVADPHCDGVHCPSHVATIDVALSMTTASPVVKNTDLIAVSSEWDFLQFDYEFSGLATGAVLSLDILHGAPAEALRVFEVPERLVFPPGRQKSPWIEVSPYQGQQITLRFTLDALGPGATAAISNVSFFTRSSHANAPPQAHAGLDRTVEPNGEGLASFSLDGSRTADPDSPSLLYWWLIDGELLALGATPAVALGLGCYQIDLVVRDDFDETSVDSVVVEVGYPFVRGDVDGAGEIDITDGIYILNFLFVDPSLALGCEDAADVDDNGELEITDGIALLSHLFLGGAPPKAPYPNPGLDPTPDGAGAAHLGCERQLTR